MDDAKHIISMPLSASSRSVIRTTYAAFHESGNARVTEDTCEGQRQQISTIGRAVSRKL